MGQFKHKQNRVEVWRLGALCAIILASNAYAAAPVRQNTYTTNTAISSSAVTANEDAIFNYLSTGVDTYADNSIVNADISAAAAIQSDKLTLSSVGQPITMSSNIIHTAKGANVASAATVTLGTDGNVFTITGTTTITSVTIKQAGTIVVLIFAGALTFTDGSNLKLAGNFSTTADDTITLVSDGTDWFEIARAVN